jgi:cell division protein FtsN
MRFQKENRMQYVIGITVWCIIIIAIIITFIIIILNEQKAKIAKKLEFQKAREKIMEDGKVDGPGKYVPHKKWENRGTPHETTQPGSSAYNGDQWQ